MNDPVQRSSRDRATIDPLPASWRLATADIEIASEDDLSGVACVYSENADLLSLIGPETDPHTKAEAMIRHTELPPGGRPEQEQTYVVRASGSDTVDGVLQVYRGYPEPGVLYLGELYLRPVAKGRGLGATIVEALEHRAREAGASEIRLGVGLRNWGALRFWVRMGYDRITKVSGDRAFAENAFAVIELARQL